MDVITVIAAGTFVGLLFKLESVLHKRREEKKNQEGPSSLPASEQQPNPVKAPSDSKQNPTINNPAINSESVMVVDEHTGRILMDSLTKISGISSAMAGKLNEAGVLTYKELSMKSPENLVALLSEFSITTEQAAEWVIQGKQLNNHPHNP